MEWPFGISIIPEAKCKIKTHILIICLAQVFKELRDFLCYHLKIMHRESSVK